MKKSHIILSVLIIVAMVVANVAAITVITSWLTEPSTIANLAAVTVFLGMSYVNLATAYLFLQYLIAKKKHEKV